MTMGSELRLTAWTSDEAIAGSAFSEVFAEFDRLDNLMSVWREGSDIQRLNDAAGDHAVSVSRECWKCCGSRVRSASGQAGSSTSPSELCRASGSSTTTRTTSSPIAPSLLKKLPLIDYRALEVRRRGRDGVSQEEEACARISAASAKGYAVERSAAILRRRGLRDFMIQSGGDLYVSGRRGERPWRVGIRDPRGPADKVSRHSI